MGDSSTMIGGALAKPPRDVQDLSRASRSSAFKNRYPCDTHGEVSLGEKELIEQSKPATKSLKPRHGHPGFFSQLLLLAGYWLALSTNSMLRTWTRVFRFFFLLNLLVSMGLWLFYLITANSYGSREKDDLPNHWSKLERNIKVHAGENVSLQW